MHNIESAIESNMKPQFTIKMSIAIHKPKSKKKISFRKVVNIKKNIEHKHVRIIQKIVIWTLPTRPT